MSTTVSKTVAMTPKEMDEFLAEPRISRVSTVKKSGAPHVSPAWFYWDGSIITFSFGKSRLHIANLKRNPNLEVIVDQGLRPQKGLKVGAQAVMMEGKAELTTNNVREITEIIAKRYLGKDAPLYIEPMMNEGRILARLRPNKIITWDFSKSFR
jgi:PPOX class probable F420-dependent enzyme